MKTRPPKREPSGIFVVIMILVLAVALMVISYARVRVGQDFRVAPVASSR